MSADGQVQVGRLAIRREGENVNAYYAMPGTMEGALWLASIKSTAADQPGVLEIFMDLGRAIVGEILFEETGQRPTWGGPEQAAEHERGGRA
jgi:hypothetical protein